MAKKRIQPTIRQRLMESIETLHQNRTMATGTTLDRVRVDLRRQRAEERLADMEKEYLLQVCNEKDENGKPVYTNESLRKTEIANRIAKNEEATKTRKFIDSMKWKSLTLKAVEQSWDAGSERAMWMTKVLFLDYAKEIEGIQYAR